ncbi:13259_t:CDS:2, partial [Cetraspora pellucida]
MFYYHQLTSYIEVLDQKANDFNKYAICLACLKIKNRPYALEKQFTNTKKCYDTDNEAIMQKHQEKRFCIHKDNNNRLSNYALKSVLLTSSGKVLVQQTININGERAHTEEVKNKINEITKSVTNKGIKVPAIVTDSHSSYAAARKHLQ